MSTLNVANITDGTDTVETGYVVNGSAKAWVNFNGEGTIAARNSLNVASLTDNGTGDYTLNLSNSMANGNYCISGSAASSDSSGRMLGISTKSTSAARVLSHYASNTGAGVAAINVYEFNAAIQGDLA